MRSSSAKLILFFICLFASSDLLSEPKIPEIIASTEGEPSTIIGGYVNGITGDLVFSQDDIVIEGVEPIRLKRIYISGDGKGDNGGWEFFPHLKMKIRVDRRDLTRDSNAQISEPWGTPLRYIYQGKEDKNIRLSLNVGKHAVGLTNCGSGIISGRTNLKNNRLVFHRKLFTDNDAHHLIASFRTGSGGVRIYSCYYRESRDPGQIYGLAKFRLSYEKLPNGNYIFYKYESGRLISVTTTGPTVDPNNPQDAKIYAQVKFHYFGDPYKNHNVRVETSDGRQLYYAFASRKEQGQYAFILHHVEGDTLAKDAFEYERGDSKLEPKVSQMWRDGLPVFMVRYYSPGDLDIEHKDDLRCECVKELHLPNSKGEWVKRYTFTYNYNRMKKRGEGQLKFPGSTEIIDHEGNRTIINFSDTFRPLKIEKQKNINGVQTKLCSIEFQWGDGKDIGNLISKKFYDSNEQLLWSRIFEYDNCGNVIKEFLQEKMKPLKQKLKPTDILQMNSTYSYMKKTRQENSFNIPIFPIQIR